MIGRGRERRTSNAERRMLNGESAELVVERKEGLAFEGAFAGAFHFAGEGDDENAGEGEGDEEGEGEDVHWVASG